MPHQTYLTFGIDRTRYAIPARSVVEVVRAVAVDPLPGSPPIVTGIIDFRGSTLPVFDVARRFHHDRRAVRAAHRLIIADAGRRRVVLHVDSVEELVDIAGERIDAAPTRIADGVPIAGIARTDDGLVVIQDLEGFLTQGESEQLDAALAHA